MNTDVAPNWLPPFAVPFVTLSYPTSRPAAPDSFPDSSYFGTGLLDACFIITCIAVMAVLRDAARLLALEPLAKWKLTRDLQRRLSEKKELTNGNGHANEGFKSEANGIANGNGHATSHSVISKRQRRVLHRSMLRFAEQGWSFIYYTWQWSYGLYIHRNLPTSMLHPVAVWTDYPHIPLAGPLKFYYLTQTAFYMHQMLILNAEARRKDHWQMMTHHVVTVALMVGSYFYNYTRVGVLTMLLMDAADVFFPLAKMLRYLSFSTLCDVTFGLFMVTWFITRHVLFVLVIVSVYKHSVVDLLPTWDPKRGYFLTASVLQVFLCMLICLEILQLIWFGMIVRVAWRVVSGQGAEDTRSDDENDIDNDNDEADPKKNQ